MNDIDITQYLPILTLGLWVGVSMTFISKLLSFVISTILYWFKKSV